MLRLTGGEFNGRPISTPKDLKTRPSQAKLRQALFNSLQFQIPGARILDLFAGSGALGFEALSRGAAHVTFVETSRAALKCLEENIRTLGVADRARVISEPVERTVKSLGNGEGGAFDIVLADPPYAEGWELKLLQQSPWNELLATEGVFCLEWSAVKSKFDELPEQLPFLVKVREKNYGDSILSTFKRD
jgi:16S rRNA (guanine966-N2)-methyltransferase